MRPDRVLDLSANPSSLILYNNLSPPKKQYMRHEGYLAHSRRPALPGAPMMRVLEHIEEASPFPQLGKNHFDFLLSTFWQ